MINEFGFTWGPITIERACSDEKKGWRLLIVKTARHPNGLQIYVTKTGKVRVFDNKNRTEWKP
jgi:hypothetical protein